MVTPDSRLLADSSMMHDPDTELVIGIDAKDLSIASDTLLTGEETDETPCPQTPNSDWIMALRQQVALFTSATASEKVQLAVQALNMYRQRQASISPGNQRAGEPVDQDRHFTNLGIDVTGVDFSNGLPDELRQEIRAAGRTLVQLFHSDALAKQQPTTTSTLEDAVKCIIRSYRYLASTNGTDLARYCKIIHEHRPRGPASVYEALQVYEDDPRIFAVAQSLFDYYRGEEFQRLFPAAHPKDFTDFTDQIHRFVRPRFDEDTLQSPQVGRIRMPLHANTLASTEALQRIIGQSKVPGLSAKIESNHIQPYWLIITFDLNRYYESLQAA